MNSRKTQKGDDAMQLLKLLSEVVRISSARGEGSFLLPGSAKVAECMQLLTKIITSSKEVPAVVR